MRECDERTLEGIMVLEGLERKEERTKRKERKMEGEEQKSTWSLRLLTEFGSRV